VPDDDHTGRIELRHIGERVDAGGDVEQSARPASSLLADTAVLEVPGSEATSREVERQRGHHRAIPALAPEAAVDEHDTRPGTVGRGGQVQVGDLIGVVAVADDEGGGRPHALQQTVARD
jgi:hypothetical protein